jgi:hypothetical protein
VVVDEAHHATLANSYGHTLLRLRELTPALRVLGMTATPYRLGGGFRRAAQGVENARGFLVHEGALGRREAKVMLATYKRLCEQLIEEGILVAEGDAQLRLTKSYLFDAPSAAASVLSGGNKNGRTEWRDEEGRTLKQLQEEGVS